MRVAPAARRSALQSAAQHRAAEDEAPARRRAGARARAGQHHHRTTTAPQHHHTNIVTNFQQSRSDPREERTQCRKTRGEAAVHNNPPYPAPTHNLSIDKPGPSIHEGHTLTSFTNRAYNLPTSYSLLHLQSIHRNY